MCNWLISIKPFRITYGFNCLSLYFVVVNVWLCLCYFLVCRIFTSRLWRKQTLFKQQAMPLLQYQMWHVSLQGIWFLPYKLGYENGSACLHSLMQTRSSKRNSDILSFLNLFLCFVSLPLLKMHQKTNTWDKCEPRKVSWVNKSV